MKNGTTQRSRHVVLVNSWKNRNDPERMGVVLKEILGNTLLSFEDIVTPKGQDGKALYNVYLDPRLSMDVLSILMNELEKHEEIDIVCLPRTLYN